jgi:hypothetical protein
MQGLGRYVSRKALVLGVSYAHVLLTAGVVFGWAALEECYSDLTRDSRDRIFTVAASTNYLSNLFFGPYLDKYGAVKCSRLACSMMVLAAFGMVAAEFPDIVGTARSWLVLASFGMLGFAGPGVQMPTLRCELLFPESAALVTSINASLFDASCVVFLVFKLLLLWVPGLAVKELFIGYALLMLICLILGQLLFRDLDQAHLMVCEVAPESLTKSPWMMNAAGTPTQFMGLPAAPPSPDASPIKKTKHKDPELEAPLLDLLKISFNDALRSFQFVYLVCFCAINILRVNFVVMTLNTQLAVFFGEGSSTSSQLSLIFSGLLPLGGFAAPLTAYLLEKHRRWSYRVCLVLSLMYGLGLAFPLIWTQLVAYVIISVSRQLTYSIVFALTSSLFGQEHLGKLLACNNAVVFTFGLLQYPLAQLVGSSFFPS